MADKSRVEITIMSIEEAIPILRQYKTWREFHSPWTGGTTERPDIPTSQEINEALGVAITMLASLASKPEKEYYGC